jgi:UDP-glucose 4-epimerase
MRVLITGSAGFLGGHVADAFVQAGHEVTGFDQRETNLPEVQSVLGDFLDEDLLTEVLADKDVICHIGAIGDVYLAAEQPALAASVNVAGSATVGRAAAKTGTRVVYASTWEVYGEPEYEPVDEQHRCEPDHPYNITKLAGERVLLSLGHLENFPVIALRLGTAYGLGMRPNSVFNIFMAKAKAGEPITIQGDGSQGRQFTHAKDIARAFLMAAASDREGMALNTVASEMISIKQLAEIVSERFPTEVTFGEARPGDVAPSYVSSERIREVLGWTPEVAFEDGMAELLADFEQR